MGKAMFSSIAEKTRGTLVAGFVLLFLVSLPGYVFLTGISSVAPRYLFLISLAFVFFCDITYKSIQNILPFVTWHVAFLLIGTGSFIVHYSSVWADSEVLAMWGRVFVALWAVIIGASLPSDRLMRIIAIATLITAMICLLDIALPFVLYKPTELMLYGRGAGLFLQPNGAASALALGFLVSHSEVDKKRFYAFFALTLLGLLATLSRGALLCLLPALLLVRYPKMECSRKTVGIAGAIAFLVAGFVYSLSIDWESLEVAANLWLRVLGGRALGSGGDVVDLAALERLDAARKAWDAFAEFPWFGLGIGHTRHWDLTASAHNMYLTFAAEFGVAGLVLSLLYFVAVYYSVPLRYRYNTRLVLVFLCLFFLFTHNHFDDYVALLIIGILVGASLRCRRELIPHVALS